MKVLRTGYAIIIALAFMAALVGRASAQEVLKPTLDQLQNPRKAQKLMGQYKTKTIIAPDFTVKNLEGKSITLSDYRGKMYVVIETGSST